MDYSRFTIDDLKNIEKERPELIKEYLNLGQSSVVEETSQIETITLTEISETNSPFESSGYSEVKVTHNGVVKKLKIPIKSSGISQLVDSFKSNEPQPPGRKCKVEVGTDIAKDLGITKTQWVFLSDYSDTDYIKEKEKHESDLGMLIVLKGINMTIKDKDGNVVDDDKKKIEILRNIGMTGEQFSQIVRDIGLLTRWEDEKETDFLQR